MQGKLSPSPPSPLATEKEKKNEKEGRKERQKVSSMLRALLVVCYDHQCATSHQWLIDLPE